MYENVPHEKDFSQEIVDFAQSNELLQDPTTRRDYFEHVDEDDFIDLTQQVASLVRSGDANVRQHFDGEKIKLLTHDVPDHREKEQLLRETWRTACKFLTDREIPDEDALEYAALTVAGGFLYAHPLDDSNGRTSRVLSYLIAVGDVDIEDVRQITTESSTKSWSIAPLAIALPLTSDFEGEQPANIDWEFQFVGETQDALDGVITGSSYSNYIIRAFLEQENTDENIRSYLEQCSTHDEEDRLDTLDGDTFLKQVVNDPEHGVAYAAQLLDLKRHAETEYVRKFLQAMESDVFMPPIEATNRALHASIRKDNKFLEAKRKIMEREFARRAFGGKLLRRDEVVMSHRAYSRIHHRGIDQAA